MNIKLTMLTMCIPVLAIWADTPEKLDDLNALRAQIPRLAAQADWRSFATPEEIKLFDGPETVYAVVPATQFDLSGFDATMLGSPVPPAGVHPRVLFSPQDVPLLKSRLERSKIGRNERLRTAYILSQTLFNPESAEGKIFEKLAAGKMADLCWPEPEKPKDDTPFMPDNWFAGYKKSMAGDFHTSYLPNFFAAAAFQCLLDGDELRGRKVAAAVANYCTLRDPVLAQYIAETKLRGITPDTHWSSVFIHVGGNNLAFAYDCAAKWMDDGQKKNVRQMLARAVSGRRAYGMNGPARWAETNWSSWGLEHYLAALAIEGEEGFDPAVPVAAQRTLKGFLQWGINEYGTIFECNGKNYNGFKYAALSMIALARRGENLFGHPHFRAHPLMQVQSIVPAGGQSLNNGTWGNGMFTGSSYYLAFFPDDPVIRFLYRQYLSKHGGLDGEDVQKELANAAKGKYDFRKMSLLTPAHCMGPTPYTCIDWPGADDPANAETTPAMTAAQRAALHLSPDFIDPVHGLVLTRSGDDADALFMMFEARPDLNTVGHQHHDAGHFYVASHGEMWAVEHGGKSFYSGDHNVVRIDGLGLADVAYPPRVKFIGAATSADGTLATAELTNAYNHAWVNPSQYQWNIPAAKTWKISVETDPAVVAFYRGTQQWPMRIWGDSHWSFNWGPVMRVAAANPVKGAFRSAGIVRGKHPYALVIDDVDKGDGREHLYEWTMCVPGTVRLGEITLPKENPTAVTLLKEAKDDSRNAKDGQSPAPRSPALMVCRLDVPAAVSDLNVGNSFSNAEQPFRLETKPYAGNWPGYVVTRTRLFSEQHAVKGRFLMLLLPFRQGEAIPTITWDTKANRATIQWRDQKDEVFFVEEGARTRAIVTRDGKEIAHGK